MDILKKGSKSEDVKKLQQCLGLLVDGDFGNTTERLVKDFQKKHNLVQDGIVGPKTWDKLLQETNMNNVDITYQPIDVNITKSLNRKIKYLVIHYTAGTSSKSGEALKNSKSFCKKKASADFCVDDETIIQVNPDIRNYYCWAVGDGKGKNGIYNKDCVSIEICSNLKKKTTYKKPNHSGWSFTDESLNNALNLSKYIMNVYDIPLKNVIRHFDVSGKSCPGIIGWNTSSLFNEISGEKLNEKNNETEWLKFKEELSKK